MWIRGHLSNRIYLSYDWTEAVMTSSSHFHILKCVQIFPRDDIQPKIQFVTLAFLFVHTAFSVFAPNTLYIIRTVQVRLLQTGGIIIRLRKVNLFCTTTHTKWTGKQNRATPSTCTTNKISATDNTKTLRHLMLTKTKTNNNNNKKKWGFFLPSLK